MPQRNAYRNLVLLMGGLVLLSSMSCSKGGIKLYPVRGSVSFDGKPPEGAVIYLNSTNPSLKLDTLPTGVVKADGTFVIGTLKPGDGAPAGDYNVSIAWYPPNLEAVLIATGKAPTLLPPHLSDPKTSGLKMQVKEGDNDIPQFKLESGTKK